MTGVFAAPVLLWLADVRPGFLVAPLTAEPASGQEAVHPVALVLLVLAAFFSVAAGIGLMRFKDPLSRLHAATKPQVLGLALVIAAVALQHGSWMAVFALLPVFVFQALTAPIAAHMVGRAAYRAGKLKTENLRVDELAPAIERSEGRAGREN